VGFDWKDIEGVIDKLAEEVGEFKQAESQERREEEFGDLLFTLANIARRMEIDLESALRGANRRFYQRFTYMEKLCRERGTSFAELSFDQQNALWEEAKKNAEG
jgi:tetrapyrrole methylase family protein/MazG family protein